MVRFIFLLAVAWSASSNPAAAQWPPARLGEPALGDAAYDAATGIRFIPTQLVVPAGGEGGRRLEMPATSFMQPGETSWHGPLAWLNPYSGETLQVYDRRRSNKREGDVFQKMALRREGDGLGRVYDSRFDGGMVCSGEVKFPVGLWRQGEIRRFDYDCLTTVGGKTLSRRRASTVTVEAIDFVCGTVPHCFSFRWRHFDPATDEVL